MGNAGSPILRRAATLLATMLAIAGFPAGCGLSGVEDAGADAGAPGDAPTAPPRVLTVDGESSLTLAPLAERTLRFQLSDDRRGPVSGSVVSFALDGTPRSSTLRQLDSTTDALGIASVVLVAGPQPTTFQVRATSSGAAPVTIDVSVGTEFGELVVLLEPEVSRGVDSYFVRAVADVPCADVLTTPSGDERRLATELATTTFPSLSTAASWTIVARGQTASGHTVARGCVEGVRVAATAPARASVTVRDLPLDAGGTFGVTWTLEAGGIAAGARERAFETLLGDGGAKLFLDGLHATLEAESLPDADILARARDAALDERLAETLRESGTDLADTLGSIADEVDAGFAGLELVGTVRPGGTILVSPFEVHVGADHLDEMLDASVSRLVPLAGRDAVEIAGLEVRGGAGSLWVAAFEARSRAHSPDGLAAVLRDGSSCGTLVTFLASEALLMSCDARCARTGCSAAAELLVDRMRIAAAELDASSSVIRLDATLAAGDTDDDLRADTLDAEADARWESTDGSRTTSLPTRWSALRDDTLE